MAHCPFVPSLVAAYVDSPAHAAGAPQRLTTAALFADITGFTALSERLAGDHEALAACLNKYFSLMGRIVAAAGGDVLKFAGDALIVAWPEDGSDLAERVARAGQCALELQAHLHRAQLDADTCLSVKVGVGVGGLVLHHLGPHRGSGGAVWRDVVPVGPALQQAFDAEHAADDGGDVLLSGDAARLAGHCFARVAADRAAGAPLGAAGAPVAASASHLSASTAGASSTSLFGGDGTGVEQQQPGSQWEPPPPPLRPACPEPSPYLRIAVGGEGTCLRPRPRVHVRVAPSSGTAVDDARLREYVCPLVRPWLDGAVDATSPREGTKALLLTPTEGWLSALRTVSVLFISLGLAEPQLAAHSVKHAARMRGAFGAVLACVARWGGHANKVLVDDKGATLIAVFGLAGGSDAIAPLATPSDAGLPAAHASGGLAPRCPPIIDAACGDATTSHFNSTRPPTCTPAQSHPAATSPATAAALCALDACARLWDLRLRGAVGGASGAVFAGIVGGTSRREFTVLGDAVNTAARLMQRAGATGGGVLLDEATRASASPALAFTPLERLAVKGRAAPVWACRPYTPQCAHALATGAGCGAAPPAPALVSVRRASCRRLACRDASTRFMVAPQLLNPFAAVSMQQRSALERCAAALHAPGGAIEWCSPVAARLLYVAARQQAQHLGRRFSLPALLVALASRTRRLSPPEAAHSRQLRGPSSGAARELVKLGRDSAALAARVLAHFEGAVERRDTLGAGPRLAHVGEEEGTTRSVRPATAAAGVVGAFSACPLRHSQQSLEASPVDAARIMAATLRWEGGVGARLARECAAVCGGSTLALQELTLALLHTGRLATTPPLLPSATAPRNCGFLCRGFGASGLAGSDASHPPSLPRVAGTAGAGGSDDGGMRMVANPAFAAHRQPPAARGAASSSGTRLSREDSTPSTAAIGAAASGLPTAAAAALAPGVEVCLAPGCTLRPLPAELLADSLHVHAQFACVAALRPAVQVALKVLALMEQQQQQRQQQQEQQMGDVSMGDDCASTGVPRALFQQCLALAVHQCGDAAAATILSTSSPAAAAAHSMSSAATPTVAPMSLPGLQDGALCALASSAVTQCDGTAPLVAADGPAPAHTGGALQGALDATLAVVLQSGFVIVVDSARRQGPADTIARLGASRRASGSATAVAAVLQTEHGGIRHGAVAPEAPRFAFRCRITSAALAASVLTEQARLVLRLMGTARDF